MAPQTQGQRRKIVAVYLDPSNFKNIGGGHTIADQINEVLEPYDLGVIPASNDRIGGVAVDVPDAAEGAVAPLPAHFSRAISEELEDIRDLLRIVLVREYRTWIRNSRLENTKTK